MNTYQKHIFTYQEKAIWEFLKDKTLREISEKSKLNITRVFRIKNFGGMRVDEMNKLQTYCDMIRHKWI